MAPKTTKRRSPGEGSVWPYQTKAGERWAIGHPSFGTRRNAAGWGKTKRTAQQALRDMLTDASRGELVDPSRQPLGAYLDEWAEGLRLAPSTIASYRKNIRLHIAPALGAVPLNRLTTERIDRLYRDLERGGRADRRRGEGLSPRTVRYVHTILSAALAAAVKTRRLARNPAADASPPTARQAKAPEMHPWNAAQLRAFLDWSRDHRPNHAPWHVLAYTGMRRGELLAPRWHDIDLDAATVSVRRKHQTGITGCPKRESHAAHVRRCCAGGGIRTPTVSPPTGPKPAAYAISPRPLAASAGWPLVTVPAQAPTSARSRAT
jgi:integrase